MPARFGLQHIPSDIKPVMLRPQHHYPSPTSGPILSCSYVKPIKLRLQLRDIRQHALYALAPTRCQLRSGSNTCPRDVQGLCNPYNSRKPIHVATTLTCSVRVPTHISEMPRYFSPCKPGMLRLQRYQPQHTPRTSQKVNPG